MMVMIIFNQYYKYKPKGPLRLCAKNTFRASTTNKQLNK